MRYLYIILIILGLSQFAISNSFGADQADGHSQDDLRKHFVVCSDPLPSHVIEYFAYEVRICNGWWELKGLAFGNTKQEALKQAQHQVQLMNIGQHSKEILEPLLPFLKK